MKLSADFHGGRYPTNFRSTRGGGKEVHEIYKRPLVLAKGIDPMSNAYKAFALPLSYTSINGGCKTLTDYR